MKRLGTSLTALAFAGALSAGLAPTAFASDAVSAAVATQAVDVQKSGREPMTFGGTTFYPHNDRVHWVTDSERVDDTLTEQEKKTSDDFVRIIEEQKKSDVANEVKQAEEDVKAAEKKLEEAKQKQNGTTCIEGDYNGDGVVNAEDDKVADLNGDGTVTNEERSAAAQKAHSACATKTDVCTSTGASGDVNGDGVVNDADAAAAASAPHCAKPQEQTMARGINAETGSNTFARGTFALLVVAAFGAAFAARRRFFA